MWSWNDKDYADDEYDNDDGELEKKIEVGESRSESVFVNILQSTRTDHAKNQINVDIHACRNKRGSLNVCSSIMILWNSRTYKLYIANIFLTFINGKKKITIKPFFIFSKLHSRVHRITINWAYFRTFISMIAYYLDLGDNLKISRKTRALNQFSCRHVDLSSSSARVYEQRVK